MIVPCRAFFKPEYENIITIPLDFRGDTFVSRTQHCD